MKRLSKTIGFLWAILGIQKTPIKEGKLDLSKDQEDKIIEALGEKDFKTMVEAINKEAKNVLDEESSKKLIEDARAEFKASLEASGYTEEEIRDMANKGSAKDGKGDTPKAKNGETPSTDASLEGLISDFKAYQKRTDIMIAKLIEDPEPDPVIPLNKNGDMKNLKHSATHLFGDGQALNEFTGRPWNQRAAGLTNSLTSWDGTAGEINLQRLNGDVELFYRENPSTIESLHRDMIELPSFWQTRFGVKDRISDGKIVSDEITQARKLPWLAKNNQRIQPETREIFDVSIDLEWVGDDLQKYEKSWLQGIMSMEGSTPYKMTFVQFLVTELMKKAKAEDRMSAIKGVYVATPDDATVAGRAINRQNGLLYQLYKGVYIDKKVKVPSIGLPTPENIVDYAQLVIEKNIKEESKEASNLVYYMPKDHERWYKTRYRQLRGVENDFTSEDRLTIENYENIRIEPLHDLNGTNVHIITFDDNIEIMEDVPNEKGLLTFERLKRIIYGHADYKFACAFIHLGTEVTDDDPDAFKVQTVWTNGVFPFKSDFYIPFHDDKSGKLKVTYSNLSIVPGFETDIATLEKANLFEGQTIRIRGNTSGVTSSVKNNANFDLASNADYDLSSGGTLTLVVTAGLTLREVKRTTEAVNTPAENFTFDSATVDLLDGITQIFNGEATTLTGIENGTEQQKLTLLNSGEANLTVNNIAGNVSVVTEAVVKPGDTLVLTLIDGVFTEFSRTIA
jgi:hypothetical protein